MNIPYCILKEKKYISNSAYDYHQSLAKRLYNSYKKRKSSNSLSDKIQNNYSKKKIYKWLFNLDYNNKLKICSIYNDWFSKILFQLLTYFEYDNTKRFSPLELYEDFYKKTNPKFDIENFDYNKKLKNCETYYIPEENFSTFFKEKEPFFKDSRANKNEIREKNFLKELKFFSINNLNDILTIKYELWENKQKLQEYFDTFSNCKIFSEPIIAIKTKNNNIYNFSFPNWVSELKCFSVPQLIVICFEQIISIYYQIYLLDEVIPNFEIDSKIKDFLNMKLNIENYLGKKLFNENIFDLNKIQNEVYSKQKDLIKYYENISENVYEIAFGRQRSAYFNDETTKDKEIKECVDYLKKIYEENIPNLVDIISFIDTSDAIKINSIIYNIIYQELSALCSQQNLDDLCSNIDDKPKKKKKKKKNKKNNNINEEETKINSIDKAKDEIKYNLDEENKVNNDNNANLLNNANNNDNNSEDNEYNINNNLNSINSVENSNNINNSDDDEDNYFSNDCFNKYPESIERIGCTEKMEKKGIEYAIEMKDLNENGKEIKNEEEKEINENDLLKELMEMNIKEKKKKKKRRKNKKKTENIEENIKKQNQEEIIEKRDNINSNENNKNKNEEIKLENEDNINNISNNNIKKNEEINNKDILKETENKDKIMLTEENKNNKKKHKEFFLFTVDNKKKKGKKNKPNKINQEKSINKEIKNEYDKENNKSKEQTSQETINSEKSKLEKINLKSKNNLLINEKINQIELEGKKSKSKNENSINIIDSSNKIEYLTEFNKTKIIIPNNNNIIIIEKDSNKNINSSIDNFSLNMNNIFIAPKNCYPPLLPSFCYPITYPQLPNYYLNEQNELFNELSKEILSNEDKINNNLNHLAKYREQVLNNIKTYIEKILKGNNFEIQLIIYGSYETKLSIEISDIDILIKFSKNNINNTNNKNNLNNLQHIEEMISLLYYQLNNNKAEYNIFQVNAIYTASVPVLKIKCDLTNIIPNDIKEMIKKEYLFNFEEDILQLNFDFTFIEVNTINEDKYIPSLEIVSYIKNSLNIYKEIKPIILFLKRYMKINKLNSSFHGGLSSYSLFLLLYAYIKSLNKCENSVGYYLYGFFEFYSNFNFGIYSINAGLNNPFTMLNELHESGIMLIDPITKLNVAKSTFKVDQIKSVLMKGMIIIRNIIYQKMLENKNFDYVRNKNIFLDELFKNRNGTIILEQMSNQIPNQISIGQWK